MADSGVERRLSAMDYLPLAHSSRSVVQDLIEVNLARWSLDRLPTSVFVAHPEAITTVEKIATMEGIARVRMFTPLTSNAPVEQPVHSDGWFDVMRSSLDATDKHVAFRALHETARDRLIKVGIMHKVKGRRTRTSREPGCEHMDSLLDGSFGLHDTGSSRYGEEMLL